MENHHFSWLNPLFRLGHFFLGHRAPRFFALPRCGETLGPVEVFAANAGVPSNGGYEVPNDEWDRTWKVNVRELRTKCWRWEKHMVFQGFLLNIYILYKYVYMYIYILYSVLFLGHCVFLVEAVHFNVIFDGLKLGLFWF
jgi:NAD(P)-dependent dehydrogenase (short-subunit alcohol dehydrogenase family)